MVKVKVKAYCKHCGNEEITEVEKDVDGTLAGDVHCRQCGNILEGDISAVRLTGPYGDSS
jgi:uncharacterized Zn finger protein